MVGSGNAARQDGHSPRACVLGCMQATSQKLSLSGDGSSTGSTARRWLTAMAEDASERRPTGWTASSFDVQGGAVGFVFLTAWHRIGEMQQRRRCDEMTREGLVGAN